MRNNKLLCSVVLGSIAFVACAKQGSSPESENAYAASNAASGEPSATSAPNSNEGAPATASVLEPGPVGATGPADVPAAGLPSAPKAASAPAPMPLTDGQIIKVAETVDTGEIDQAKEVQKKAKNPEVKKLAARILQQHTKNKQKSQSLAKKAQLTSEDSSVASDFNVKSEASLQTIKTAQAPSEAERAFVDAQVRQQETALELLNTRLIPSAMNADLKAQLEETRKVIEKHIEETKRVQHALETSAPALPPSG
jgi:putative membrane protein